MAEEDVKDWAGDLQQEMDIDAIEITESDLDGSGVEGPISFSAPAPDGSLIRTLTEGDFKLDIGGRHLPKDIVLPPKEKLQKLAGVDPDMNARKLRVALQDMTAERDSLLARNKELTKKLDQISTRNSATNLILENERVRLENNELNEQMLRKCVESDAHLYSMKKIWWILRWLGGYDPDSANTQEPYVWLRKHRETVGDIPHDWYK